jgi:proteic killer suppression protein
MAAGTGPARVPDTFLRYIVHVNGPWCMTFEFEESDALRVDFEQYH